MRRILLLLVCLVTASIATSLGSAQTRTALPSLPYCPHPTAAENAASGYKTPDALNAAIAAAPEADQCQADPTMLLSDNAVPAGTPGINANCCEYKWYYFYMGNYTPPENVAQGVRTYCY